MGSLLGDWPSYDPHNFSQLRPADPSAQPSVCVSLSQTHAPPRPPFDSSSPLILSLISNEARNILLRHFYQKSEEKFRPKRAASDHLTSEHNCKQPRAAYADGAH
ncbi:unnamed protein product [Musa hybrid cultivar]